MSWQLATRLMQKSSRFFRSVEMATMTKLNLRPLGERVIVKAVEQEEKTASGIYLPDTAKEKPNQGEVLAVGPGRIAEDGKTVPMNVKAGDRVLYGKYSGQEVKLDGVEYLIIKESDIYAIVG
jgi:chaperonin GroES